MIYENNFKYWIFDLDNTIYDIKLGLFKKISERITNFIVSKYSLDIDEAKKIQKKYYLEYGLTLRGLILEKNLNPEEFLDYVHDVEHPELKKDKYLKSKIEKLKGKKIIFTNGSKKHAVNVITKIGIEKHFDGIFDIVESEFMPKPAIEPYKKLVKKHKIDPNLCVFIEDIARNLKPAYEMGMKTVWIENNEPWAKEFSNNNFVNYKINNLSEFLKKINLAKAA